MNTHNTTEPTEEDKAEIVMEEIVEVLNRNFLTQGELEAVTSHLESLVQQLKEV